MGATEATYIARGDYFGTSTIKAPQATPLSNIYQVSVEKVYYTVIATHVFFFSFFSIVIHLSDG